MTRAAILLMLSMAAPAFGQAPGKVPEETPPPEKAPETQPPETQAPTVPPQRPVVWTFKIPTEIGFNTKFDNQPGSVTVSRLGAEAGVGIPIATRSQLDIGVEYEYSRYDFTNATGFVAGATSPFRDIHRELVRARYGQQETMQLSWMVAGYVGFSAEEGAELGDSVVGGAFAGVGYYLSRTLKVGGAVGVFSRFDDLLVLPIPSLDWEIDPQWRLSTDNKLGLTVFYAPSDDWTLSLGGWYDERNFRLDQDGPVPGGVARDSAVPIQFGATFRATPNLSVDFGAGVKLFGNYQIDNSSGGGVADINTDPSAYVSFSVGLKF